MLSAEFEPEIPACHRPKTLALDRSTTVIGSPSWQKGIIYLFLACLRYIKLLMRMKLYSMERQDQQ